MCDCSLLVDKNTSKPINVDNKPHKFTYRDCFGVETILLEGFEMTGVIDYAAAHKIKNMWGVKKGYVFIVGERADEYMELGYKNV